MKGNTLVDIIGKLVFLTLLNLKIFCHFFFLFMDFVQQCPVFYVGDLWTVPK